MSLVDRIRAALWPPKPEAPARLRNKPQGMAWLKPRDTHGTGAYALAGRAVQTVALLPSGKWAFEPKQHFIAGRDFLWGERLYRAGDVVGVDGAADEILDPWKEDGDGVSDAEVRELYRPNTNKEHA